MSDVEQAVERLANGDGYLHHGVRVPSWADIGAVLDALKAAEQERDAAKAMYNCHSSPCRNTGPDNSLCAIHYIAEDDDEFVALEEERDVVADRHADAVERANTAERERDRLRKALLALLDALKAPVRPVRSHKDD